MENEEGQDRLVLHENEPVFENLPNFRQAGGRGLKTRSGRKVKDGLLFRSSRTDFVTRRDTGRFQELGIKTIVDLRRQSEYERSDGDKILDSMYQVRVLKDGQETSMKPSLRWGKKSTDESSGIPLGQRLLVNMWTMDLIWHTFYKLNFFLRWLSLVLVGIDWVFGTHFFVKLYTWLVINETSLAEQYMEVLEFTKPVIADILRLLSRKEHLPALIHCAHGKDRTGIIVMLVMGCLGVEEDQIVSDYAKSELGLASIKQRVYEEICERYGFHENNTKAPPDVMRELLRQINERWGSIPDYLLSAGFTEKDQERLKSALLDE